MGEHMERVLFHSGTGDVTAGQIRAALQAVGAADCDILYIHTDMTFGLPALKRRELLAELLGLIESLGVGTLVFPTFTFSFCNDEVFDVQNSSTPMGALNEYARKTGRGIRSRDPLLSVYVLGEPLNLVADLGIYSIGKGSNYDRLHECGKETKFLFFGADMRNCFTYVHYMEATVSIPYRYDRAFAGTIIDNGETYENQEYILYSTYANVRLNPVPVVYNAMKRKNQLSVAGIGDSQVCCFSEKDAYNTIYELLMDDPLCLTDGTFDGQEKDMRYIRDGEVVSVK